MTAASSLRPPASSPPSATCPATPCKPGEALFTLRPLSETLHQAQTELYKAAQDIKLAQAQRQRLAGPSTPEARLIEVDAQIARLQVVAKAYRQELTSRGFSSEQIDAVADGRFVTEVTVGAPRPADDRPPAPGLSLADAPSSSPTELQELKVELGQQVQAGQTLCLLANHHSLAVEGRAFRDEAPLVERAVREGWPVEADFQEPAGADWPPAGRALPIRYLANTVDPVQRTFAFLMPLENQSRVVERDGRTVRLWRFRPGQKVRLRVPVEKLDKVFVLPAGAVTRDGAEAFVFTQNVNTFERKSVRLVLRDRETAVVANDGSLVPGQFVVQGAAAQLNRLVKSQSSAVPKGYHIHADGSLHKNGEPD